MKQRIKNLSVLLFVGLLVSGCSSKYQSNDLPNDKGSLIVEFEKDKLEKQIISENKNKWIDEGFKRAWKIVNAHKETIISYELGKYARKKGYVTEPEIVTIDNGDGTIQMHNLGCRIQKPLSVDELINIFGKSFIERRIASQEKLNSTDSSTNFSTNIVYGENEFIKSSDEIYTNVNLRLSKTYKNKNVLEEFGINYIIKDNHYLASFDNLEMKNFFCKSSRVCK